MIVARLKTAGVGDDGVQADRGPAEVVVDGLIRGGELCRIGDIERDGERMAAVGSDLGHERFGVVNMLVVGEHDDGPIGSEPLRNSAADPARATGDQRTAPMQRHRRICRNRGW